MAKFELKQVLIRDLGDAQLQELSRNGHLFLNLTEMKAIQAWYKEQGREPTDIELETLAQTWSEHCVHKTLKSAVEVTSPEGTRRYGNLIKETIFAGSNPGSTITQSSLPGSETISVFSMNGAETTTSIASALSITKPSPRIRKSLPTFELRPQPLFIFCQKRCCVVTHLFSRTPRTTRGGTASLPDELGTFTQSLLT